jgi:hypothetical protein
VPITADILDRNEALTGLHGSAAEGLMSSQILKKACENGRVLWIVDDVPPSDAGISGAVEQWCPVREDVTLLCTSRGAQLINVECRSIFRRSPRLQLPVFSPARALGEQCSAMRSG